LAAGILSYLIGSLRIGVVTNWEARLWRCQESSCTIRTSIFHSNLRAVLASKEHEEEEEEEEHDVSKKTSHGGGILIST
jgi:hypothetical protein